MLSPLQFDFQIRSGNVGQGDLDDSPIRFHFNPAFQTGSKLSFETLLFSDRINRFNPDASVKNLMKSRSFLRGRSSPGDETSRW